MAKILTTLCLLLLITGCQTGSELNAGGTKCQLKKGMDAGLLAKCNCFEDSSAQASIADEKAPVTRTETIINYICPIGPGRFARVSVVNGIVDAVDR